MSRFPEEAGQWFRKNGINQPLFNDRQVVRASDLTLLDDRHDRALARLRRLLHGWGVVAGFGIQPRAVEVITVSAGYAITPRGDEIYLPEVVVIKDIATKVRQCCGQDGDRCALPDPERDDRDDTLDDGVIAHLVARPVARLADLRPAKPNDCAHPASQLLPARACGGVQLDLICELPELHAEPKPLCSRVNQYICGEQGRPIPPLPMPDMVGDEDNFVVLATLEVQGNRVDLDDRHRRTLLPVDLLQNWIQRCLCPVFSGPIPLDDDRPEPGNVDPSGMISAATNTPITNVELAEIRTRLADPVAVVDGIGPKRSERLADIGVVTEGDLLAADSDTVSAKLDLPVETIRRMKVEIDARHGLGLRFER